MTCHTRTPRVVEHHVECWVSPGTGYCLALCYRRLGDHQHVIALLDASDDGSVIDETIHDDIEDARAEFARERRRLAARGFVRQR